MSNLHQKPRILTGDTPTGRLHLGHWVGSVERRVALQDSYDCYFLLANMHAFTTRFDKAAEIRQDTIEIVKDWLAAGIDPERSTIVLQTRGPIRTMPDPKSDRDNGRSGVRAVCGGRSTCQTDLQARATYKPERLSSQSDRVIRSAGGLADGPLPPSRRACAAPPARAKPARAKPARAKP